MSKNALIVRIHKLQMDLRVELQRNLATTNQALIAELHSQLQAAYTEFYDSYGLHSIPGNRPRAGVLPEGGSAAE